MKSMLSTASLAGRWAVFSFATFALLAITAAPVRAAAQTTGQWQEQKLSFTYTGVTAHYSCSGLRDKVRSILLTFGARDDLKVKAIGCGSDPDQPSSFAWVTAEFNSLAAATDSVAANGVKAEWTPVRITPHRPAYMEPGECELIDQMQETLKKGFALRNANYRMNCTPHQISSSDYDVTAEVLKAAKT